MQDPESPLESDSEAESLERRHADSEATLRKLVSWVAVLGTMAFVGFLLCFLVIHAISGTTASGWLPELLAERYPALVGIPISAVGAYCVVTLLKITHGPIELEGFGVKFRGGSAPIVFWVLCFLVFVFALHLLWPHTRALCSSQPNSSVPGEAATEPSQR